MVMRGDFKASILIKLKYYIYDLISILKRIFFLEGEGLKKDEVFLVLWNTKDFWKLSSIAHVLKWQTMPAATNSPPSLANTSSCL